MSSNADALANAIERKLIELGRAGPFVQKQYDDEGLPLDVDPDRVECVEPASVHANETDCAWEHDDNYGRALTQRRTQWLFDLELHFDSPVVLGFFEETLETPNACPIVRVEGRSGAVLRLVNSKVAHPVKGSPATGTRVTYTFLAEIGRY